MANYPPRSVVITYNEDDQQLIVQLGDSLKLAPVLARTLKAPILLDEFDFKLDDEFVRRFGAGVLTLIALGQPEIKQYMSFTPRPIDGPSEE